MKTLMNFTSYEEDTTRYDSVADLRQFYQKYGCSGIELMPIDKSPATFSSCMEPDMVVGIHTCSIADWMNLDTDYLVEHYRKDLDYARDVHAEYVVFHVTQVSFQESLTYIPEHTDQEVIEASCKLINQLLDGQDYHFHFLMENLWWPGLNLMDPSITKYLLDHIHYEKKGLMLDTGHLLHTNQNLRSQSEALSYLKHILETHKELYPFIKGIHLQQSLTGEYVQEFIKNPPSLKTDPDELFAQAFTHIFQIDKHLPFTEPGIRELVDEIDPLYLTYEYITSDRKQHEEYLMEGSRIFTSK